MSDEPDAVPLRDYLEARLQAVSEKVADSERVILAKLEAIDKATVLSRDMLNVRLEGLNEWRQQSKDREIQFLPRQEFEAQHAGIRTDIRDLQKSRDQLDGKASQKSVNVAMLLGGVAAAASIISIALKFVGK